jgi:protein-tyrosine phosphatase
MVAVLFVCLGNICRSAAAEGVFRALIAQEGLADRIAVDSAATHDYQIGRPPDARAQAVARARGIDISRQRARQASQEDFLRFDYILAMDRTNLADLAQIRPSDARARLHRFLDFTPALAGGDVPDPYYGNRHDFGMMMDLIETGARGLLAHLRHNELSDARAC